MASEAPPEERSLLLFAWLVSILATLGSLRYSGIGFLGIEGLGLPPCELCWYQRIFMYPLPIVLGFLYFRKQDQVLPLGLALAVPGGLLALFHSLIQHFPHLEPGACIVGSCTAKLHTTLGLTIPNQSLIAFLLVAGSLGLHAYLRVQEPQGNSDNA